MISKTRPHCPGQRADLLKSVIMVIEQKKVTPEMLHFHVSVLQKSAMAVGLRPLTIELLTTFFL